MYQTSPSSSSITGSDPHSPYSNYDKESAQFLANSIRARHSSTTSLQSNDSWLDPLSHPRRTSHQIDESRKQQVAYEYLCHLEEARSWISLCLNQEMPPSTKLEDALRNGVIVGKLANFVFPEEFPLNRIYDRTLDRFNDKGLEFRHTDNINFWIRSMQRLGLPKIFYPTTTDIYDKKNMPKVIYCIHAFSIFLTKLGMGPALPSLVGQVKFTDEEIDLVQKELDRLGVKMPAFGKIDGLLREQLTVDQAAMHAAELSVYQAIIDNDLDKLLMCLKSPYLNLATILNDQLIRKYFISFQKACHHKLGLDLNTIKEDDTTVEGEAYNYVLSRTELLHQITLTNEESEKENTAKRRLELVSKINFLLTSPEEHMHEELLELLLHKDSGFLQICLEHAPWYWDILVRAHSEKCSALQWDEMRNLIALANDVAQDSRSLEIALLAVDESLNKQDSQLLIQSLLSPSLGLESIFPENIETYHTYLYKVRENKRKEAETYSTHSEPLKSDILDESEIQESLLSANQDTRLTELHNIAICNINTSLKGNDPNVTLNYMLDPNACLKGIIEAHSSVYFTELSTQVIKKDNSHLTQTDIQSIISTANDESALIQQIHAALTSASDDSLLFSLLQKLVPDADNYVIEAHTPHYRDLMLRKVLAKENGIEHFLDKFELLEEIADGNESSQQTILMCNELIEFNRHLDNSADNAQDTLVWLKNDKLHFKTVSEVYVQEYHDRLLLLKSTPSHSIGGDGKLLDDDDAESSSSEQRDAIAPLANHSLLSSDYDQWIKTLSTDGFQFYYLNQAFDTPCYSWRPPLNFKPELSEPPVFLPNSLIQSIITSITIQYDREAHFQRNIFYVIKIQSFFKMVIAQRRLIAKLKHYNSHEDAVIKIQACVRKKLAVNDYNVIMSAPNPQLSSVRKFLNLLEQSDRDLQEELDVTALKAKLVTKIRDNKQLEEDLDAFDTKIGLLVRNRLNVMEVVRTSSKIERRRLNTRSGHKGLQYFTKENKVLLESYQHLFYLLQTNPSYLAKLIIEMPVNRTTTFMQDVILTVFNYASNAREHFLLLKLFETALREEVMSKVDKPEDIITGNPIVIKLIISFNRKSDMHQQQLKDILSPLISKLLENPTKINLSPVEIYKQWISHMEMETGESIKLPYDVSSAQALDHDHVRSQLAEIIDVVKLASDEFMHAIFSNVDNLPYGLRYMSKKLLEFLKEKFSHCGEDELIRVVGNLLYYRFLNPVIAAPDAFGIIILEAGQNLSNEERKKLGSIARILQHAAANKKFEGEFSSFQLNPYIEESHERFKTYFRRAILVPSAEEKFDITEYSDLVLISRPVINISAKEIISTHKLLIEHKNAVVSCSNDPLIEVLSDFSENPDIRNLLGDMDEKSLPAEEVQERWIEMGRQEIMLTLSNKFEALQDDEILDQNALFFETKGMIIDLLKVIPGNSIPEILASAYSQDIENKFNALVNQFREDEQKETNPRTLVKKFSAAIKLKKTTLAELKYQIRVNLDILMKCGQVKQIDNYQDVLNAIARDIRNQHKYRQERSEEKSRLNRAIEQLDVKRAFNEEQFKYYQQYVDAAIANMSKSKGSLSVAQNNGKNKGQKVKISPSPSIEYFKSKTVRYTAQRLFDKGILIDIEGVAKSQYKALTLDFVSVSHGVFDVYAKMLGLPAEKVQIVFEDLLQLQFENVQVMKILDRVKVNVNLLIFMLNKKFYGK